MLGTTRAQRTLSACLCSLPCSTLGEVGGDQRALKNLLLTADCLQSALQHHRRRTALVGSTVCQRARMLPVPGESFYLAGPRLGSSFAEFYVRMCERATALLKGSEMASLVLVDTI